jgi:thymidine phosphorylase
MARGTLFLIVGPSGAGKDALIDGARAALATDPRFVFARRIITREADAGGEDHLAATPGEFADRQAAGGFLLSWQAHGLHYGLSAELGTMLAAGRHVVANVSRAVISQAAERLAPVRVVLVTAPPEILARRLEARGREDAATIGARLQRAAYELPDQVPVTTIVNDGPLAAAVGQLLAVLTGDCGLVLRRIDIEAGTENIVFLHRDSAEAHRFAPRDHIEAVAGDASIRAVLNKVGDAAIVAPGTLGLSPPAFAALGGAEGDAVAIAHAPPPPSQTALRAKLKGATLTAAEIEAIAADINARAYSEREVAGFLALAARHFSVHETIALARARARFIAPIAWPRGPVVDKHSIGGIPGNRMTPIVVAIVAAAGFLIPKASSRAITSAAGTADVVEVAARIDLAPEEMRRVVLETNGCLAWSGRLGLSPLDTVMHAIERPLALDTDALMVSSILAKKAAAGVGHVVIDIPVGPAAKIRSQAACTALGALFTAVADALGLAIRIVPSDGRQPVGRGVGPALEMRDVGLVLANHAEAPRDLRDKALDFAGHLLSMVDERPDRRDQAREILESGAALARFERILDAQGRNPAPPAPAPLTHDVVAPAGGRVTAIDCHRIAGIARRAGAPTDKGAGLDLLCKIGDSVAPGIALYRIHAGLALDLRQASAAADEDCGYTIGAGD